MKTFQWKKHPEADQFIRENAPHTTDTELTRQLNERYPDANLRTNAVTKHRQTMGIAKPTLPAALRPRGRTTEEQDAQDVLDWLQKEPLSIGEISRRLDRSKESIIHIVDKLRAKGYEVELQKETHQVVLERDLQREFKSRQLAPFYRSECKFMQLSDAHLCSRYQQLTLLHTAYKIAQKEGCHFAINHGDTVEGVGMYRGQEREVFLTGADEQTEYAVQHYPRAAEFKTYVIPGSHDLSWMKQSGYNILKSICKEREDLVYSHEERQFRVRGLVFDTLHPSGGIPYARSYRLQKLLEGAIGDTIVRIRARMMSPQDIPQVYGAGHLHVAMYMPYLGFHAFMVPCFQAQTPYLRDKGHSPQIGFWITTVKFDDEGNVTQVVPDYRDMSSQAKTNDY